MSFFEFLTATEAYSEGGIHRLNTRKRYIVDVWADELAGATVLDLAAHDGRWSYALAAAGAAKVVGIEARPELIARYDAFPDTPFKPRVKLRQGDIYDALDQMARNGRRFDVVALFGILYHVMDHMRLMRRIAELRPRLVLVDSEFLVASNPMVQILHEATHKDVNATALFEGQAVTLVGVPSMGAMEAMAGVLGYRTEWSDWDVLPKDERHWLHDYYRPGRKRRMTCALRPADPDAPYQPPSETR